MKRLAAALTLIAALTVLVKLAGKGPAPQPGDAPAPVSAGPDAADLAAVRAKYPADRELVERVLDRYRRTALAIEHTDGLRGLKLLDRLDLEALYLFEKHPDEFRRLAGTLTDEAAADLLLHWSSYFGLKRADDVDRQRLISEIGRLGPSLRRLASRHPQALPLILAEPEGMADLIRRLEDQPRALEQALIVLEFVSLEQGATDLKRALGVLDRHRTLALDAFRLYGPEGFALVSLYGPVLESLGEALPLDQALIVLRVNSDFLDEQLATGTPETVALHLRHVAAAGLVEAVGGSPHGLRLAVQFGAEGDRALQTAGADAADVVFEQYDDPALRNQAVRALGQYGPMAAAILAKYSTDPDFAAILSHYGPAVIPPIARADVAPEALLALQNKPRRSWSEALAKQVLALSGDSGQATIRLIRKDGLDRAQALDSSEVAFYQFLPLYDVVHLAGVLGQGHAPTRGELAWALVDGCFVVMDVLSLTAVQPGAAVASEAVRSEVKATARQAARSGSREVVEEVATTAAPLAARTGTHAAGELATDVAGRTARWWAVRSAGGPYALMRRMPAAIEGMSLTQLSAIGRPMARKAGLRLSSWAPRRLLRNGQPFVLAVPADRLAKYAALNAAQVGVGLVAMHKMEEYLGSRRSPAAE